MTELVMKNFINKASHVIGKRLMTVSIPPKNDKELKAISVVRDDNIGTCVAFNKPKMPPFLGPLVLLSLIEMLSRDKDEK